MDLKQLNAFVAIADLKSFSAAAKFTGLSQPSLSRQLKQLEAGMGVTLINRYHRPLQLTEAGQFFYDKVSAVLTELDTITSMTQRMGVPDTALNIGFVPSVLYGLLPEVIKALKQNHGNIEVNLKDISSYQQIEALKSGDIDVGFGRFAHQDSWVQQILLRHERYVVALPKNHPLTAQKELRLMDLANNRLILYHQTHLPAKRVPTERSERSERLERLGTKQDKQEASADEPVTEPLLYLFAQYGITPRATTTVSDLQVALGLVAAGIGITLVPASSQTMRVDQVSYQRLIHENLTSPIYLHTLKDVLHPHVPALLQAIYTVYERRGITYRAQQFR